MNRDFGQRQFTSRQSKYALLTFIRDYFKSRLLALLTVIAVYLWREVLMHEIIREA